MFLSAVSLSLYIWMGPNILFWVLVAFLAWTLTELLLHLIPFNYSQNTDYNNEEITNVDMQLEEFTLVASSGGDLWYEYQVQAPQKFCIRLQDNRNIAAASLPFSRVIIHNPDQFIESLNEFISRNIQNNQAGFMLEAVEFWNRKRPWLAEVVSNGDEEQKVLACWFDARTYEFGGLG